MKYNSKLEIISNKKVVIGIDIAKHTHYANITGVTHSVKVLSKRVD